MENYLVKMACDLAKWARNHLPFKHRQGRCSHFCGQRQKSIPACCRYASTLKDTVDETNFLVLHLLRQTNKYNDLCILKKEEVSVVTTVLENCPY